MTSPPIMSLFDKKSQHSPYPCVAPRDGHRPTIKQKSGPRTTKRAKEIAIFRLSAGVSILIYTWKTKSCRFLLRLVSVGSISGSGDICFFGVNGTSWPWRLWGAANFIPRPKNLYEIETKCPDVEVLLDDLQKTTSCRETEKDSKGKQRRTRLLTGGTSYDSYLHGMMENACSPAEDTDGQIHCTVISL